MALSVFLRDKNPDVVKAWERFFGRQANLDIGEGDPLQLDLSAVVTPGNSFGIMDAGFAQELNVRSNGLFEGRIRKLIEDKYAGELPVGTAEVIKSGLDNPQFIVVSPTVRVPPERLSSANVNTYLATRAAFRAIASFIRKERQEGRESPIESVALVGMGTGLGKIPPVIAAFQMYEAYCQVVLGHKPNFATIESAAAHDQELRKSRYM
ncbi:MAG: hypothetical protein K2X93_23805 [Candidatus Obscuribacterales bacterium]|nr:hypothetical protein [Candidatus Obscuribacterales bacterium]